MRCVPLGDRAVLITPGAGGPSPAALAVAMSAALPCGVIDVMAAFGGVSVVFDPAAWPPRVDPVLRLRMWAEQVAEACQALNVPPPREIELPVTYGGKAGPDLPSLADTLGLSADEIVARHAGGSYAVAAVGFLPGFAYLDGLDPALRAPRRTTPRLRVPAGSVAVGGPYTGVYPVASPGGWHAIGLTDVALFDPARPSVTPFAVGDRVRFVHAGRP